MAPSSRSKYKGENPRLILAFDIGTTFSGVSYAMLEPGKVPKIQPVTRYPDQERVGGDAKIPTVIYYDSEGVPCAVGAETLKEGIEIEAREKKWVKAHWFKLHLRPKTGLAIDDADAEMIPALPTGMSVVGILADYITYLDRCAKAYVEETHGPLDVSDHFGDEILYVLTHPNGWGGPQQAQLREAAIRANIIPDTEAGRARINFVTEGEASLHYCLANGLQFDSMERSGILIVDAGGGTIDITAYRRVRGRQMEEIDIPTCHFFGSIFITGKAERHIRNTLGGTKYDADIEGVVRFFDRSTKHVFYKVDDNYFIPVTSTKENDSVLGIRGGQFTLPGQVSFFLSSCLVSYPMRSRRIVETFFRPSCDAIIEAIKTHRLTAHPEIKAVFLVGGFSASRWLFENIKAAITPLGLTVARPDAHVNKAVSNGAVAFYLDNVVSSRVSRMTYGTEIILDYVPSQKAHFRRRHRVRTDTCREVAVLWGAFDTILPENTRVKTTKEFRRDYTNTAHEQSELKRVVATILSYRGEAEDPQWVYEEPHNYPVVCTVEANTSLVQPKKKISRKGKTYYEIRFQIALLFGLTELKAQIVYKENGVEKRGSAKVVYDENEGREPELTRDDRDNDRGDDSDSSDGSDYCD